MSEVLRFSLEDGSSCLFEVADDDVGVRRVSRGSDGVLQASRRLTDALSGVRQAAQESIEVLQRLSPETIEMEFGVKLAGEAGAVIAKTAAEGHFTVTLSWVRDGRPRE